MYVPGVVHTPAQQVKCAPMSKACLTKPPPAQARLDAELLGNLGRYRRYRGSSLRDLLRVIRNKHNHWRELPEALQARMGPPPDGFLRCACAPRMSLQSHSHIYTIVVTFPTRRVKGTYHGASCLWHCKRAWACLFTAGFPRCVCTILHLWQFGAIVDIYVRGHNPAFRWRYALLPQ